MLNGVKGSGNLVVVIINKLPCGRKIELGGVWILNVIRRTSSGNLEAISVTTDLCCGGK